MSTDATAIVRRETARLVEVLTGTDPAARVPTCPEWTAADLLWHVAEVHRFWAAVLGGGVTTEEEVEELGLGQEPRPEDHQEIRERRKEATAALLEQLEIHGDEDPAWFWYPQVQGVGATRRMQVHESTIHRVDAELTAGVPVTEIPDGIARAGVDHVLDVMWPAAFEWIPEWASVRPVAVVRIEAGDGGARMLEISRWSGTRPRDSQAFDTAVGRRAPEPDVPEGLPVAALAGPPMALDLWVWGRDLALEHLPPGTAGVEISGDDEAIDQLRALHAEGHD